ncbi:tetratricopeptide repeat protein [Candidatus Halobeggiatoa sp. HSG11]|nr:tetratricopeptide repeat protein [Candidatus Halobeggiatoa sp. HSG11]
MLELNLNFPDPQHLVVTLINGKTGEKTGALEFISPFSNKGHQQLSWYLEQYANQYSSDIDDESAKKIEDQLPELGKALFNKTFAKKAAHRLYKKFRQLKDDKKIITITSHHSEILSLPWELLHDSKGKKFLITENISIQRRINCENHVPVNPQQKLHVLFIISRPTDTDFVDPRINAQATLDSLQDISQQVTLEFLRPATLQQLQERLQDQTLPHIDAVHFDGYSTFEAGSEQSLPTNSYILFEQQDGKTHKVPTDSFAKLLNQQQINLVILSAATNRISDMNYVAVHLITAGIQFVLSMNYSLLQPAAQKLFATFYTGLTNGYRVGDAVDNVRFALYKEPERRDLIRLNKPAKIELYDWFVPTLYHHGYDAPLLIPQETMPTKGRSNRTNLPFKSTPKFFGHRRDLWNLDRRIGNGMRRANIYGPEGQGKTCLVQEAGRWMLDTGRFASVVYIDYANTQNIEPTTMAISAIAKVLQKNLTDVDGVTQALERIPTLIILDNVDALGKIINEEDALIFQDISEPLIMQEQDGTETLFFNDEPVAKLSDGSQIEKIVVEEEYERSTEFHFSFIEDAETKEEGTDNDKKSALQPIINQKKLIKKKVDPLTKLLNTAKKWSEAGQSCVVIISSQSQSHPQFVNNWQLGRLEPVETIRYFDTATVDTPRYDMPRRQMLEQLFGQVNNHPLSVGILTYRLKQDDINNLNERLAAELHRLPVDMLPEDRALKASMQLFTETLEPQTQRYLPKLGVFKNGAFENVLRSIVNVPEPQWRPMRQALEESGLVQTEKFDGLTVEYLGFHPSLTGLGELAHSQQSALQDRYQQGYYELANFLYNEEGRNPYHAQIIEQKEMPNLLTAAHGAMETGKDWANDFGNKVDSFLSDFGLMTNGKKFAKATKAEIEELLEKSEDWFDKFSEQVKLLVAENRPHEAQEILEEMLEHLATEPSYERCLTLGRMGNCAKLLNNIDQAVEHYQQQLIELKQLKPSDQVNHEIARAGTHLADILTHKGDYASANGAYVAALSIMQNLNDVNSIASIHAKLGTLQKSQDNFKEAEQSFHKAYTMFKQLNELQNEAAALYQLGTVYQQTKQWKAANQAYLQANEIFEQQNDLPNTVATWQQLAHVNQMVGNLPETEKWYRQAIEGNKTLENWTEVSIGLTNLAELLQEQLGRLEEAQQLAEAGLAIDKAHNPDDVEIWKTYLILAKIADKQHHASQAEKYRRLARSSKTDRIEYNETLEPHKKFIEAVVSTAKQPKLRKQLNSMLEQRKLKGWDKLVTAVQRFLDGEKDVNYIIQTEHLDSEDTMIVHDIARKIDYS